MAVPTLTFDGLNLNDGSAYTVLPGVELGARQKTYDEYRSFTGAVAQVNVSEAHLIEVKLPILVQGSSVADLDAKVQTINAKIDGCTAAATKALVYGGTTYQIAASPRVAYAINQNEQLAFWTKLAVVLNRLP